MLKLACAITMGALLGAAIVSPAFAATFSIADSLDNGELLTSIPGDDALHVLYSVDVGSLAPGDILVVKGDAELTNNSPSNILLNSVLIFADSPDSTSEYQLDEGNEFYVSPAMNHAVPYKQAIHMVSNPGSKHYVNFAVAASGGSLAVEQGSGRLQVLVIHP